MLEITCAVLVVVVVTCAYAALWVRWRRARHLLAGLPSYQNLPFIGSYLRISSGEEAIMDSIREMSEKVDETNLPFVAWIGPVPLIMFHNIEDVKIITNTFVGKPYIYDFMREWLGDGIFTAPVPLWKRSIKILGGTFSTPIVDSYQGVFDTQAQFLLGRLKGEVGRPPFDIMRKHLGQTTIETITQTALGTPRISERIVTTEHYTAFLRNLELLQRRTFTLPYHLDFLYHLTPSYREMRKNVAIMQKTSEVVINKKLKEREEKHNVDEDENDSIPLSIRCKSYLEILLEMREMNDFLTINQIKSEIDTLLFGGQETIATTLSFIMMVIGQKPDIQDKMYSEIREIFGDSNRSVHKEDLGKMQYCEAVIFETLRLYPSIVFVARTADKELQVKSCTIPKGAHCGINMWGAGRSWRVWGPDVLEFRPERWLESPDLMNSSFILNFSYGRRACIGKKYALALMKTVLVHCLRELRFSSKVDLTQLRMHMSVLRVEEGHMVSVEQR